MQGLGGAVADAVGDRGSYAVVHTYASRERYAVMHLGNQGFDAFCPLEMRPSRRHPGRMEEVPLFPCYVFLLLRPDQQWRSVNSTYGVIRIVTDRHPDEPRPLLVDDLGERVNGALARLRRAAEVPFPPGTVVRVRQGPFTSFEGVVESMDRHARVRVLLSIFSRDTSVVFDVPDLEAAG